MRLRPCFLPALLTWAVLLAACSNTVLVKTVSCGANCGGCCDERGRCVEGTSKAACGFDGVACAVCETGSTCQLSECTPVVETPPSSDAGPREVEPPDAGHTPCPPDGWCDEGLARDGGRLTTKHLRSVWAVTATDVWAVGDQGAVLHSDGAQWTMTNAGVADDLMVVWGSSASDVWAGGGSGDPSLPVGVLLHFDGAAWTVAKRGTRRIDALWGSARDDVWAAGVMGELWHFDGQAWSPVNAGTNRDLCDLGGTGRNAAWAVGSWGEVTAWNGTAWTAQPSGVQSGLAAVLVFSPTQAWAVGGHDFTSWNGAAWSARSLDPAVYALGLWGASPTQVWTVGPEGEITYFDGATMTHVASGTTALLRDVHGTDAAHVWAVGFGGTLLRYRP